MSALTDVRENQRRPVLSGQARRLSSGPPSEPRELILVRTVGAPGRLHRCCEVERA
jgi:hypothetical protein